MLNTGKSYTKDRRRSILSLLIKTTVVLAALSFIYHQVFYNQNMEKIKSQIGGMITTPFDCFLLFLVFGLMLLNWGIESYKWRFLMKKVEKISFHKAVKAIFAGACVSIFTPNRLGEFGGRIFYVKRANRLQTVFITLLGNAGQLIIAIAIGVFSTLLFAHYFQFQLQESYGLMILSAMVVLIWIALLGVFLNMHIVSPLLKKLPKWLGLAPGKKVMKKWRACADIFNMYSRKELGWLLIMCLLRFTVYCIQFYLLLSILGITLPLLKGMVLISMCFFTLTIVPTVSLTELGIRGSAAIYFIGFLSQNDLSILTASFSLWAINLVIPAIIGSYFVYRLKLFPSNNPKESNSGQITPARLG